MKKWFKKIGLRYVAIVLMAQMAMVSHATRTPAKVLEMAVSHLPKNLDPAVAEETDAQHVLSNVYEGLMSYQYDIQPCVVMYTKSSCSYCSAAKELLNKENIPFQEIEITNNSEEREKLKRKTGQTTVPYVFVENKFIGGYSDLLALKHQGMLCSSKAGNAHVDYICKVVPQLAAAMPKISFDRLVYTFEIKPEIRFQDDPCFLHGKGRQVVAEDVAYTIKRIAHAKTGSPEFVYIKDKIKGLDQWRKFYTTGTLEEYAQPVEGLKVLDKYTIQITLNKPCPLLLHYLAMPSFGIVAKEAVTHYGAGFTHHPVGTGPFVLREYNPNLNRLVLIKNPTFHGEYFSTDRVDFPTQMRPYVGKKLPLVDKVILYGISDSFKAWSLFNQKRIDLISIGDRADIRKEVLNVDFQELSGPDQKGIGLRSGSNLSLSCYAFNCLAFPFRENVKLRQAISLAFNREQYNELFYDGLAILPESILPAGAVGPAKGYKNPYYLHDLQKAKASLQEAGYRNGEGLPPITLDIIDDKSSNIARKQAEFFAECMRKVGITIQIVEQPEEELHRKIKEGTTMMYALNIRPASRDTMAFLSLLADSQYGMHMDKRAYKILYDAASGMEGLGDKAELYETLKEMVAEWVPAIFLPQLPHLMLYHNWVKNYTYPMGYYGIEKYLDIDPLQKKNKLSRGAVQLKKDSLRNQIKKEAEMIKEGVEEEIKKVKKGSKEIIEKGVKKIKEGAKEVKKEGKQLTKKATQAVKKGAKAIEKGAEEVEKNMEKEDEKTK